METDRQVVSGREAILHFVRIAHCINDITSADIGVSVWDNDTCIVYVPARNLDFGIKPGDRMKPGSAGEVALREKRKVLVEMTREQSPWGIPYIVNAMPFCDERAVPVGCVITTERTDKHDCIRQTALNLKVSSQQLASSLQSFNQQSDDLAAAENMLRTRLNFMETTIAETNTIIDFIDNIARQTNILGINAAIEAARAGNQGAGFKVVADEVRALAHRSAESARRIQTMIKLICQSFDDTGQQMHAVKQLVQNQVAVIQELSAAGEELSSMADDLENSTKLEV
ncbi:methyl-accepting chemotaxis protein [Anaeroselena agilis]|uniref:Methyl-accepting chemotaxis protein n=1 Tax=Anaeroselena agilis TaxID=3063788 RepID=A0ABU3P349_9FIRM|nr:methyl-accepting chemotaxis protein [Selenomonadales bacterium 4137-cl]